MITRESNLPINTILWLEQYYARAGVKTIEQKIALLRELFGEWRFSSVTGRVTPEMILGAYELDLLERNNLFTPTLC